MRLTSPSEEIAAAFGSITSVLNSGIMKNPSCQDIIRHGGPFRQGGRQSSTALWDCWAQPRCLRLSEQTSAQFLLSSGVPLSLLGSFSASSPYFEISQLDQLPSLSLHDSARCSLPALIHTINNGAHLSRQPSLGQTPTQLITACCRWQTLELCVGLLHPPGILLPSHCPPANGKKQKHVYIPHKK